MIGAGGLGSPIAMYLAAAGIGKLGVVDFDRVDVSNLQRQILHADADVGRPKVESAVEHLRAINPTIEIEGHDTLLFSTNVYDVFDGYDVIVDGTDNFPVRYLVNDACQFTGKPLVYGRSINSRGRRRCSCRARRPRATGVCSRRHLRPAPCRAAPRAACSACSPA